MLTFDELRDANETRAHMWRQGREPTSLSFAMNELAGEVGEACNIAKKMERERLGMAGGVYDPQGLAMELADVVICADLVAARLEIDLGEAVRLKFNQTSTKHGFATMLPEGAPVNPDEVEA